MNERDIFIGAIQRDDPVQRREFVHQACAADEALRRRVEELLSVYDRGGAFPESPVGRPDATMDEPPINERPGTVIGPYKLLEQIGEGGMGTVWMAQQQEPVKRLVALKLIKAGMDSKQVIARFEAERQALALMDHPNIARVLDGGTTSAGRPYFVMDLVKGVPITRYCDEHHLTPRQRLELFIPVCQAVQHAHQKGIIHRDLKPSNVLVALYDGKPVPKVIDFGVAKAAGQSLTDKTLVTGFGTLVGTVEYMSPEQAEINQLDIDTRSDIYSLGVLLYELLAGSPPFSRKDLEKAGMLEMLRVIREQEPSKPSTKLSSSDALPTLSANRGTEPAKLTRLVRGELDWIVMKALEKDRNRRYETANGFAMDVQRYLADEQVLACPPSVGYRLRKFARRNKPAMAVTGLILFFIAVLGGGAGWVVRDRGAREEAAAWERLERRQRLTARVELILDDVDRLEQEQKWPEAQAAAARAETALEGAEADDAVRQRLGDVRRELAFVARLDRIRQERAAFVEGKWNDAGAARDYAGAFRDYGVDVEALPTEEAVVRLRGNAALAAPVAAALDDWVDARRYLGEGEPRWRPLIAVARGLDPDPLRDRLRAAWGRPITPELQAELRRLAESIEVKAQSPATLEILARTLFGARLADATLRIRQEGQSAYPADFWLNLQLGALLHHRKDYAGALRFYTAAVAIRPDSAAVYNNLGTALNDQQKLPEAEAAYRKAIDIDPKFAVGYSNLGALLCNDLRDYDKAIECFRKAIELDPKFALAYANLGTALTGQEKLDEAIDAYHKAIELDPKFALAYSNLGYALRGQKKHDEAEVAFRKAIEIDPKFARAYSGLGALLCDLRDYDKAIKCFRKAIELDPKFALAYSNLGNALQGQKKLPEAIDAYHKAIELDPKNAYAYNGLGKALAAQKQLEEAIAAFRKAIEIDPRFAWAYRNLGDALRDQKKLDEAIDAYHKAIELKPKFAEAYDSLGNTLHDKGKLKEAVAALLKAIELDPKYFPAHANLGNVYLVQRKFDEAIAAYRVALSLEKNHRYTRDMLALCLGVKSWELANDPESQKRDPVRAVKLAKEAVDLTPANGGAWCGFGAAQYRAGDWKAAVAALEKSMELGKGGNSLDWFFLAMARWRLGEKHQARECYDRAVQWMEKNQPKNQELLRFRAEVAELLELKEKKSDGS